MTDDTNQSYQILHIGIDDTDSPSSRCTTHMAFKIVEYLLNAGARFVDYPLLIRLNPNVPWKTRGNGAICLRIKTNNPDNMIGYVKQAVQDGSEINSGANPAVAFFNGEHVPTALIELSRIAMFDILSKYQAEKIARQQNVKHFTFGNGQGLVGSMAAIGSLLLGDHTFEAIAYRKSENCGTKREVDIPRVIEISRATFPNTFNNYDERNKRVLITPHGPDPVFCGIRGENPDVVVSSLKGLQIQEELEGYMVFRSNQGTNMHLLYGLRLDELKPFTAGYVMCRISKKPAVFRGGHVLFEIEDQNGNSCPTAVYEPTALATVALKLDVGDELRIGCSVRSSTSDFPKVLNIEYIHVLRLNEKISLFNPPCIHCGKRMKSEGRSKGFQCKKCGFRDIASSRVPVVQKRNILEGLYVPTPKAHRHLTKPIHRYGIEKSLFNPQHQSEFISQWFYSSSYKKMD
jgi:tRNA(Ile2)-agmatinylcytidine synthase